MPYSVTIQLTFSGANSGPVGPFYLYSNVDGYEEPFESCVPRDLIQSGYVSHKVPDGTNFVRIRTNCWDCNEFIDVELITPSTSPTPSVTPSISFTATPSFTPTTTPTSSKTPTVTFTPTVSLTPSISITVSETPSFTPTITATVTPFLSASITPTISPSNLPKPISGTRLANSSAQACFAPIQAVYTDTGEVLPGKILYFNPQLTVPVTGYNHVKLENGIIYTLNTTTGYVGNDTGNRCKGEGPDPTPTKSITPSISRTPSISVTPSISLTISITPSLSETPSITPTITETPSITPSISETPSESVTPSFSETPSESVTPSLSETPSITPTMTETPSITPTISETPSITPSESGL